MHSSTVRDLAGHSCFIQAIQFDGHFFYEVFWAAIYLCWHSNGEDHHSVVK